MPAGPSLPSADPDPRALTSSPPGPAMDGVRAAVVALGHDLLGLDGPDQRRVAGIDAGVEHVDARGADAGNDEKAAIHRAVMIVVAAQGRAADVPPVVVKLVGRVLAGGVPLTHDAPAARGLRVDVHHGDRVGIQQRDVGELLRRRRHRVTRRPVQRRRAVVLSVRAVSGSAHRHSSDLHSRLAARSMMSGRVRGPVPVTAGEVPDARLRPKR